MQRNVVPCRAAARVQHGLDDARRRTALGAVASWLALLGCLLAAGCYKAEPARFHANMVEMAALKIPDDGQFDIAEALEAMFGTPDEPFVMPETGLNLKMLQLAAGPVGTDELGNETGLFRRHCVHCHGITGDGAGPTAMFLNPYPRDYRQGKYKFKSTERDARPTRADLERVLVEGVPGTAMPSFRLLTDSELDALVEYVVYLSLRGETELALINYYAFEVEAGQQLPQTREVLVDEALALVMDRWQSAPEQVIRPDEQYAPRPDRSEEELALSIAAGRELFYGAKGQCVKCHGPSGLGDGQLTDHDDWNKRVFEAFLKDVDEGQRIDPHTLGALPLRTTKPRDLRLGVYRGGRRPIDIYRRVHAGINGTPMPGLSATLTQQEMWQLVDYVQSLPYEPASQPPQAVMSPGRERL